MKRKLWVPSRRSLIVGGAAAAAASLLTSCDRLSRAPTFRQFIGVEQDLTKAVQRTLLLHQPLAQEFKPSQMSPLFKVNGSRMPIDPAYHRLLDNDFRDYRLIVGGMVAEPLSLSLRQLQDMPQRTQITRHDCVEGWSAIGKWTGVPLMEVLKRAQLLDDARYIVFYCADDLRAIGDDPGLYYESIDLFDAFHPQTILAHSMNDHALEVGHGAPLRLRVERQLGYKQAKFIMRIEAVARLEGIGGGKGGYWPDRGYEWYAGI
ncbi:MAG TPA: molybdopterin-dependent oxidoreductase [Caulobacterales bacterium]|nr:molybdopterin-dependent oxidoreductase [Caulobacterales bacterium]